MFSIEENHGREVMKSLARQLSLDLHYLGMTASSFINYFTLSNPPKISNIQYGFYNCMTGKKLYLNEATEEYEQDIVNRLIPS